MSDSIKLDTDGQILAGKNCGMFVRVEHDTENTGGFYIYIFSADKKIGFDNWFEQFAGVENYFNYQSWTIGWED